MSEAAKLAVVKRLGRMLVRVVLGKNKLAEFDRQMAHWDSLSDAEMRLETQRLKDELRDQLNKEKGVPPRQ